MKLKLQYLLFVGLVILMPFRTFSVNSGKRIHPFRFLTKELQVSHDISSSDYDLFSSVLVDDDDDDLDDVEPVSVKKKSNEKEMGLFYFLASEYYVGPGSQLASYSAYEDFHIFRPNYLISIKVLRL